VRLAYLGTPEAAVPPLRALADAGHEITMVVTQPDRKRGRGGGTSPSPVKAAAVELGLPVAHHVPAAADSGAELGVVVAFGQLVKADVLDRLPMVNVHFSLLPRWRGAAPVERAILAGDTETGVCLMSLDPGLDTGPVHACEAIPIGPDDTAAALTAQLTEVGTRLLIDRLAHGLGRARPQEGEATYAAKIDPAELRLDFSRPAEVVNRTVRLGRAWTTFRGRRLRVLEARPGGSGPTGSAEPGVLAGTTEAGQPVVACGEETALALIRVQPEGKGPVDATAWANGARLGGGEVLGE
jgi:methionyl-tRNA formyltransferase